MSDHPASDLLKFARIKDYEKKYAQDVRGDFYFGFPLQGILKGEEALLSREARPMAYFSMEYGLATSVYNIYEPRGPVKEANRISENEIFSNERIADYLFSLKINALLDLPIYSGGLGVLAGDTVKTAADMRMPLVAIGILWNKGYFKQRFWFKFGQLPEEMEWDPATFPGLVPLENVVKLELRERVLFLRLWKYYVFNQARDYAVPLILLDSNVEENDAGTRKLTDKLYRSDDVDGRILQRLILGMGGVVALETLGYPVHLHHLNEGHAAFAFVQKARGVQPGILEELKQHFAYTCHTPVPAGHDRFNISDIERILRPEDAALVRKFGLEDGRPGVVNLTLLAMNTSRSINAVSQKHGEVMRIQFPAYKEKIRSITNGIHFPTWVSRPILEVLEEHAAVLGDFKADPRLLKNVQQLKGNEAFRNSLWEAHLENKRHLAQLLARWKIAETHLTVAWARRIAAYKRPSLIFQDLERLIGIARRFGTLQILYAGKAHPNDSLAFTYINDIMNFIDRLDNDEGILKVVMLENYDIYFAKTLVSSVDIWLNNPLPPYEASGTSGMKAMANGVLQLSTVDGWAVEAQDKEIGRFFGYRDKGEAFSDGLDLRLKSDSEALYGALEQLAQLYYGIGKEGGRSPWVDMMINCLTEAAHFNTCRMVNEYKEFVWNQ